MLAVIFGPEVLIVFFVALLILPLWAAIDAGGKPEWAFRQAGTSKTLWIVLPIVGIFVCGLVGIVSGIVWFTSTKAKVVAAMAGGANPGPPMPVGTGAMAPPPMSSPGAPPGWHPDPSQRHELRYFDGTAWTDHVSDQGAPGRDAL